MDKVYVLNCAWNLTEQGGEVGVLTRVFDTLQYAQEQMLEDAKCWVERNDIDLTEWTREDSPTSIQIYIQFEYDYNHIVWDIGEVEIEFEPKNK